MEKVQLPYKLCNDLMDCLGALAYNVTYDLKASEQYARDRFVALLEEFETKNGFKFEIIEENDDLEEED